MELRKETSLRISFIKFIVLLGTLIVILILANYYITRMTSNIVYPANYSEKVIQDNFEELKETSKVTKDLLTPMSNYGVYSNNGKYLYGNFSDKNKERVWNKYICRDKSLGSRRFIKSIKRKEDILLITYPLTLQYKSKKMRDLLPNAEMTISILFILELFLIIFLLSNKFAKHINKELNHVLNTVGKIEDGDLDFDIEESSIKEMNSVLRGIDEMKHSLKNSLKEQWFLEQQKREQISALAHDVKTPLTVIIGNVELLKETEITKEQQSYINYIEESNIQMQKYTSRLLSITNNEAQSNLLNKEVSIIDLLNSIKKQSESLSITKEIDIKWNTNIKGDFYLEASIEELESALMNVMSNAISFSNRNSTIEVNGAIDKEELIIKVTDSGKGFSKKMLKHAKEQFKMEDMSRTNREQHGLGLYITDNIINNYGGEVILSNNKHGSGVVIIKIPIKK